MELTEKRAYRYASSTRVTAIAMILRFRGDRPLQGARKHPQLQLHKSESPDCNRWPLTCFR
jgi:hypothetical protein